MRECDGKRPAGPNAITKMMLAFSSNDMKRKKTP